MSEADPATNSSTGPEVIDMDGVRDMVLGTHTFENVLYDSATLEDRAPAWYRTGKDSNGESIRGPSYDRFPPNEAVGDFISSCNNGWELGDRVPNYTIEEVAITPSEEELAEYKEEADTTERWYEPHFLRVPFFHHRIVGDRGLSGAYTLAIQDARNADDPDFTYDWEADYETGDVTITVGDTRQ